MTLAETTWAEVPLKFEAGTPAIAEAVGLAAAIAYLERIGMAAVRAHERFLFERAWSALGEIDGVRLLGPASPDEHAGVISFVIDGVHPHDVATVFDHHGIAVRAGHHCAQPVMARYDLPATTRASFYVYNDLDDIERLVEAIHATQRLFRAPERPDGQPLPRLHPRALPRAAQQGRARSARPRTSPTRTRPAATR